MPEIIWHQNFANRLIAEVAQEPSNLENIAAQAAVIYDRENAFALHQGHISV